MSRHVDVSRVGEPSTLTVPACVCGFEGAPCTGPEAGIRYEQHVKDVLGDAAYYEASVLCLNCSFEGPVSIPVGMDVWAASCPVCMCRGRLRSQPWLDDRREQAARHSPSGDL